MDIKYYEMSELGQLVRDSRKSKKMKLEDVSKKCRISESSLTLWENGGKPPSYSKMVAVLKFLRIKLRLVSVNG